jgi:alcohol dehydrogenase
LQPGLARLKQGNFDCLIAIGGGSPIDAAKALAVLAKRGGDIGSLCHPAVIDDPGLPVIAMPTTAGTGSESTRFTIITDDSDPSGPERKLLCIGLAFLPVAAVVDYELTLGLPPRVTADTGIDALTHAIEAYVSRRAGPFSDFCALQALSHLAPNLRRVFVDGNNRPAREAMMLGATLAGMAFSNASVALVHGMSRPIGALFHVPHGLSNAMLLPTVTAYSLEAAPARYQDCARAMGLASCDALIPWLIELNRDLAVPSPATYGIKETDFHAALATMAEQALASGSPSNNPRIPTANDIVDLYRHLWNPLEYCS